MEEKIKNLLNIKEEESLLDVLYAEYMNTDPVDQARLDSYYRQVEQYIQELPFHHRDQINCIMNALCAEQDRIAFLDGVRTGARLILELQES